MTVLCDLRDNLQNLLMSKKIEFRIPQPCHENWNGMRPLENGRFCNACAKTVVDFSMMSDDEVLHYFSHTSGNICGRFLPDQLNRGMQITERKKQTTWKYVFNLLFASFVSVSAPKAQTIIKPKKINVCSPVKRELQSILGVILADLPKNQVTLSVINASDGSPVPAASVQLFPSKVILVADAEGKVKLNEEQATPGVELKISSVGFEEATIIIGLVKDAEETSIVAHLKPEAQELPSVVVSDYDVLRQGGVGLVGVVTTISIFESALDTLMAPFVDRTMKVFPNPVTRGQVINFQFNVDRNGPHQIQIVNSGAQVIHLETINIQMKNQVKQIAIGPRFVKGTYVVNLVSAEQRTVSSKKFIVR